MKNSGEKHARNVFVPCRQRVRVAGGDVHIRKNRRTRCPTVFQVPRIGVEPTRLSTLAPETSASTISPPGPLRCKCGAKVIKFRNMQPSADNFFDFFAADGLQAPPQGRVVHVGRRHVERALLFGGICGDVSFFFTTFVLLWRILSSVHVNTVPQRSLRS